MQHKPFSLLFALAVFAWVIWIVMATDASVRISRGCEPVNWTGNLTVTIAAVMDPTWEAGTQRFFDRTDYVCRLSLWRLFYERAWRGTHPKAKEPGFPDSEPPRESAPAADPQQQSGGEHAPG